MPERMPRTMTTHSARPCEQGCAYFRRVSWNKMYWEATHGQAMDWDETPPLQLTANTIVAATRAELCETCHSPRRRSATPDGADRSRRRCCRQTANAGVGNERGDRNW